MSRYKDMTGIKINKLLFISFNHTYVNSNGQGRTAYWLTQCDCGNKTIKNSSMIRRGIVISCGCVQKEKLELGRQYYKGKKRPENSGDKCHLWRGGIYPKHLAERQTLEYKQWRTSVFTRDEFTCQSCKKVGGKLNADHIVPFSANEKLRLDINNGRTLCVECHRKTDTYGEKAKKYNTGLLA